MPDPDRLLKLGTFWCGGLALLLLPSLWSAFYGSLSAVGAAMLLASRSDRGTG